MSKNSSPDAGIAYGGQRPKGKPKSKRSLPPHTPGPWRATKPGHGLGGEYLCVELDASENYSTLEMLPADAYLIAAAPDLLRAVELLIADPWGCAFCDSGVLRNPAKGHRGDCHFEIARRAVEKAKGG